MARRSCRLLSGGYYNSEDDSDSSINVSYRENPVKVFKKKVGPRRTVSRTPSGAVSYGGSLECEPADLHEGPSPSPLSQTEPAMRPLAYASTGATPRPPLTSWDPRPPLIPRSILVSRDPLTHSLPGPPAKCLAKGQRLRPSQQQPGPNSVDSSGYSSSEGGRRKPPNTSSTSAPSAAYCNKVSFALYSLMAHPHVMKACGLLVLLLTTSLCVWLLLPLFTPLVSRAGVATPEGQPVVRPPLPPQHVVDPQVVSAAVEERIRHVLAEQQLKQQHLLSEVMEQLQLDLLHTRAQLAALDSDERLRLEQEISGLGKQMVDHQSAAAVLRLRIEDLEAQNAKLSEEWSFFQLTPGPETSDPPVQNPLTPPPDSGPETSNLPVQNQLTSELQQALETWLSERLEQEAFRHSDAGRSSGCQQPIADKMADFALETQGASVISTRCSETFRVRSACLTLLGIPLWFPSESPRTVIQGFPMMLPGKCWAFHGAQGTLLIGLSHPITITHVTLDHLPRYNSPTGRIDSAPKDFEVYGMKDEVEEGTLLGSFRYEEEGEPTQTFRLPNPSREVHRCVELRVLSNWGHEEYTCLYRFRVHGQIAATP